MNFINITTFFLCCLGREQTLPTSCVLNSYVLRILYIQAGLIFIDAFFGFFKPMFVVKFLDASPNRSVYIANRRYLD